jgi:citronellol/citronellal dehydrogenase
LWPRTTIATAAVHMLGGDALMRQSRTPLIMADAAFGMLCTPPAEMTARAVLDEDWLRESGRTDFSGYAVDPAATLAPDLFVG